MTQIRDARTPNELSRLIGDATGRRVRVTVTENRVRFLSFRFDDGVCLLRVNRHFLDADEEVLSAVSEWIRKPRQRCPKVISEFIAECSVPPGPKRRVILRPMGRHHNLEELRRKVNGEHFSGGVSAAITWGRRSRKRRVKVRRLGTYRHAQNVITIHPILDRRETPRRFLEYLIYHEMLHALQDGSAKRPHDRAFREALSRHPDHEWAMRWEKRNAKLLGLG